MSEFDWHEGAWRRPGAGEADARIVVAGDWAPIRRHAERLAAEPEAFYGDLLPLLRRADLAVVNVEAALGSAGEPIQKAGPNLRGPAEAVAGLSAVPFHVATLANNHTFDYGSEGFRETRDLLHDAGLRTVGAALSREEAEAPLTVEVAGTRVALVPFCEGEDATAARDDRPGTAGWDVESVCRRVRAIRDEADVVLVIPHAGREHAPLPPPYVVEAYRRVADAGADAVVAHHPHVPQPVELRGPTPIVYSTGNFAFFQKADAFYRHSGLLVELELAEGRLAGLRLHPYAIAAEGLHRLDAELRARLLDRLRDAGEALGEPDRVRAAWEAFIDYAEDGGEPGMEAVLDWSLAGTRDDARLGAARVRNLLIPPSQRHFWIDRCNRIVDGRMGTAPPWARELVREWTGRTVRDGPSALP